MPSRERVEGSNLTRLAKSIAAKHGVEVSGRYDLADYERLHRWSIAEPEAFWLEVFEDLELPGTLCRRGEGPRGGRRAWRGRPEAPGAVDWFPEAEVNHAECLLGGEGIALWEADEDTGPTAVSYEELRCRVATVAAELRDRHGVVEGDAVAGVVRNDSAAVVAMLAATSLGASWSSVAPDLGARAAADRLRAVGPLKVVFASAKEATWRGKRTDVLAKVRGLVESLPDAVEVVPCETPVDDVGRKKNAPPLTFSRGPFSRPVYAMFSSGTTGPPKCLVQGFGATLLHAKEGAYQCDVRPKDTTFWFTSTSWMMWNWLIGVSLATKGAGLLYDGDPFARDLFALARETNVTHFGASAGYFAAVEARATRARTATAGVPSPSSTSLRVLGSTGSPCAFRTFEWARDTFGDDVALVSTSGGTDLNGSLCTGNPWLPVRAGSLQSPGLGLDVDVLSDDGRRSLAPGEPGELSVLSAFPSAPLRFKNDAPDHATYRGSYFDDSFADGRAWRHGDFAEKDGHGGFVIHGRSDATLNAGGVRIGSAEIYNALQEAVDVDDCLVVPQPVVLDDGRHDSRVVLFVVGGGADGDDDDDDDLQKRATPPPALVAKLKDTLRSRASPRHVPAVVAFCPEIPFTTNGKKVEIAVARALAGRPVKDRGALRNPASLDFFESIRPHLDAIADAQAPLAKKRS